MSIENVLGIDLETTSLEDNCHILEYGLEVIAPNFNVLDVLEIVVHYEDNDLLGMAPEVRAQHARSGLLDAVRESDTTPAQARAKVLVFVQKCWPKGKVICMGNSVHFDKRIIRAQHKELDALLHYRNIDVSSFREAERIFGAPHRAIADVDASVTQLREYMGRMH